MMCCPARDCSGGKNVIEVRDQSSVQLPDAAWAEKGSRKLWRCTYCGFLWFTETNIEAPEPFVTAVGFYDNFRNPSEFIAAPNHPLRREAPPKPKRRPSSGKRVSKR
jgi:hypothetical protein